MTTPFSDSETLQEQQQEHVLQHSWTFFLHYPTFSLNTRNYSSQAYEKLTDVASVEAFWNVMEALPIPSEVFSQRDADGRVTRGKMNGRHLEAFGLFKTGVQPEWECSLNLKGGHWECRKDFSIHVLNMMWYKVLLALVGEVLETGRDVVGARIVDKSRSRKTEYRLEIWIATTHEETTQEVLGNIKELLAPYDDDLDFAWKTHGESLTTAIWCNARDLGIDVSKEN